MAVFKLKLLRPKCLMLIDVLRHYFVVVCRMIIEDLEYTPHSTSLSRVFNENDYGIVLTKRFIKCAN